MDGWSRQAVAQRRVHGAAEARIRARQVQRPSAGGAARRGVLRRGFARGGRGAGVRAREGVATRTGVRRGGGRCAERGGRGAAQGFGRARGSRRGRGRGAARGGRGAVRRGGRGAARQGYGSGVAVRWHGGHGEFVREGNVLNESESVANFQTLKI